MLVKKAKVFPIECVVRGYLSGSGWKDYMRNRTVSGIELSPGLMESEKLFEPMFTPSTKATQGDHDMPITRSDMEAIRRMIIGNITFASSVVLEEFAW